ncbi:hypothetical protein ADUPG1_006026 [Aduncisulcus paluster]|uniref:Uncharacterized protein n=1 Tax=Aduncisulcus paluster TaxID=2918883 RepID=A0ABQ5KGI1_9EUKA|nr:hypothetical protein ADUPG1_006026 [Aduncisulcus paluster]
MKPRIENILKIKDPYFHTVFKKSKPCGFELEGEKTGNPKKKVKSICSRKKGDEISVSTVLNTIGKTDPAASIMLGYLLAEDKQKEDKVSFSLLPPIDEDKTLDDAALLLKLCISMTQDEKERGQWDDVLKCKDADHEDEVDRALVAACLAPSLSIQQVPRRASVMAALEAVEVVKQTRRSLTRAQDAHPDVDTDHSKRWRPEQSTSISGNPIFMSGEVSKGLSTRYFTINRSLEDNDAIQKHVMPKKVSFERWDSSRSLASQSASKSTKSDSQDDVFDLSSYKLSIPSHNSKDTEKPEKKRTKDASPMSSADLLMHSPNLRARKLHTRQDRALLISPKPYQTKGSPERARISPSNEPMECPIDKEIVKRVKMVHKLIPVSIFHEKWKQEQEKRKRQREMRRTRLLAAGRGHRKRLSADGVWTEDLREIFGDSELEEDHSQQHVTSSNSTQSSSSSSSGDDHIDDMNYMGNSPERGVDGMTHHSSLPDVFVPTQDQDTPSSAGVVIAHNESGHNVIPSSGPIASSDAMMEPIEESEDTAAFYGFPDRGEPLESEIRDSIMSYMHETNSNTPATSKYSIFPSHFNGVSEEESMDVRAMAGDSKSVHSHHASKGPSSESGGSEFMYAIPSGRRGSALSSISNPSFIEQSDFSEHSGDSSLSVHTITEIPSDQISQPTFSVINESATSDDPDDQWMQKFVRELTSVGEEEHENDMYTESRAKFRKEFMTYPGSKAASLLLHPHTDSKKRSDSVGLNATKSPNMPSLPSSPESSTDPLCVTKGVTDVIPDMFPQASSKQAILASASQTSLDPGIDDQIPHAKKSSDAIGSVISSSSTNAVDLLPSHPDHDPDLMYPFPTPPSPSQHIDGEYIAGMAHSLTNSFIKHMETMISRHSKSKFTKIRKIGINMTSQSVSEEDEEESSVESDFFDCSDEDADKGVGSSFRRQKRREKLRKLKRTDTDNIAIWEISEDEDNSELEKSEESKSYEYYGGEEGEEEEGEGNDGSMSQSALNLFSISNLRKKAEETNKKHVSSSYSHAPQSSDIDEDQGSISVSVSPSSSHHSIIPQEKNVTTKSTSDILLPSMQSSCDVEDYLFEDSTRTIHSETLISSSIFLDKKPTLPSDISLFAANCSLDESLAKAMACLKEAYEAIQTLEQEEHEEAEVEAMKEQTVDAEEQMYSKYFSPSSNSSSSSSFKGALRKGQRNSSNFSSTILPSGKAGYKSLKLKKKSISQPSETLRNPLKHVKQSRESQDIVESDEHDSDGVSSVQKHLKRSIGLTRSASFVSSVDDLSCFFPKPSKTTKDGDSPSSSSSNSLSKQPSSLRTDNSDSSVTGSEKDILYKSGKKREETVEKGENSHHHNVLPPGFLSFNSPMSKFPFPSSVQPHSNHFPRKASVASLVLHELFCSIVELGDVWKEWQRLQPVPSIVPNPSSTISSPQSSYGKKEQERKEEAQCKLSQKEEEPNDVIVNDFCVFSRESDVDLDEMEKRIKKGKALFLLEKYR